MTDTELARRLEKLERDNRRFKRLGFAALVLVSALGAIYATRPVPDVIKARSFRVVDAAGVVRTVISTDSTMGAYISLGFHKVSESPGLPRGAMVPNITIEDTPIEGSGILISHGGHPRGTLTMGFSPAGKPSISLNDAEGFSMDLGSTSTVMPTTGQTQQTSADSIVMFGNDKEHRVIWKAP